MLDKQPPPPVYLATDTLGDTTERIRSVRRVTRHRKRAMLNHSCQAHGV
jgi:hypothetical protein